MQFRYLWTLFYFFFTFRKSSEGGKFVPHRETPPYPQTTPSPFHTAFNPSSPQPFHTTPPAIEFLAKKDKKQKDPSAKAQPGKFKISVKNVDFRPTPSSLPAPPQTTTKRTTTTTRKTTRRPKTTTKQKTTTTESRRSMMDHFRKMSKKNLAMLNTRGHKINNNKHSTTSTATNKQRPKPTIFQQLTGTANRHHQLQDKKKTNAHQILMAAKVEEKKLREEKLRQEQLLQKQLRIEERRQEVGPTGSRSAAKKQRPEPFLNEIDTDRKNNVSNFQIMIIFKCLRLFYYQHLM